MTWRGEHGRQKALDETLDWAGSKLSSECPKREDWNDCLIAITVREFGLQLHQAPFHPRDCPRGARAINREIYQTITARLIEQMKRGTVLWQKPNQ